MQLVQLFIEIGTLHVFSISVSVIFLFIVKLVIEVHKVEGAVADKGSSAYDLEVLQDDLLSLL